MIGVCRVKLHLPGNGSLKGKRSRLKPLLNRLRREFNLSTAEVDLHDVWQSSVIGLVTVSNDAERAHAVLQQAVRWIEVHHPDVQIVDWGVELL